MEQNKKALSAKEARELASNPDLALNRIYKLIKEAAKEGSVRIHYCLDYPHEELADKIQKELEKQGYTVSIDEEESDESFTNLLIEW